MAARWYKLFNVAEFLTESLDSRTLVLDLPDRGEETFEIFRGNYVSVAYDDGFLPIEFLDRNPYVQGSYAVYRDEADDIWFGFGEDE